MIDITHKYPPKKPLDIGPLFTSFQAWDDVKDFADNYLVLDGDPEPALSDLVHQAVACFYRSVWFLRSEWFRTTTTHVVAVLENQFGYRLWLTVSKCQDGLALASCSEIAESCHAFDMDEYWARRITEGVAAEHPECFPKSKA